MEARLSPGTWTVCVDQTVVIWPVLVANHVEMLPPNTVTTEISAIATRAMRRPYSVTAIPSSERKNFFIRCYLQQRLERNNADTKDNLNCAFATTTVQNLSAYACDSISRSLRLLNPQRPHARCVTNH